MYKRLLIHYSKILSFFWLRLWFAEKKIVHTHVYVWRWNNWMTSLHIDITRRSTPKKKKDYILWSRRWRRSIQSVKTRPGAGCGSDHELLIAKFRLKLKKVGKTTRTFRYYLNQIYYNYTVELTNRFKGLDLIECLKSSRERFVTLHRRQ